MNTPQDPPRLLDPGSDAPAWLRASLEPGARDLPGPARLARIAAGLPSGPAGPVPPDPHGPGAGPGDVPPPAAPAAPVATALPSMLSGAAVGAALGLAVVGVGWFASPRAAEPPPAARPVPSLTIAATVAEPPSLEPTKTSAQRPRTPSERLGPLSSATGRAAAPVEIASAGAAEPAVPERGAASAQPDLTVAESERAILERAQDALRGNPAEALALTDLHLARFPGGVLGQEREVIAVDALLRAGRGADARARALRFVAAFPTSAHRRRLDVLIPDLESSAAAHKDSSDRPSTP